MALFDTISSITKVLKAGESLKDPATWKNRQLLMNILSAIAITVLKFSGVEIPDADVNSIIYGIVVLITTINAYFIPATSEKVGVGPKPPIAKQ